MDAAEWNGRNAQRLAVELEAARGEIERLRATLNIIADGTEHPCAFCFDAAKAAKAALAAMPRT